MTSGVFIVVLMEKFGQIGCFFHGVNPDRDKEEYIVTACRFCNGACNRTEFDTKNKKPEEIIALKKIAIEKVRESYKDFFDRKVSNM